MKRLASLALVLSAISFSQEVLEVSGTVYDRTSTPAAHASVSFYSDTAPVLQCVQRAVRNRAPAPPACLPSTVLTTVADSNGRYSMSNLKPNSYIAVVNVALGEQRAWWAQEVRVNALGKDLDLSSGSIHAVK